MLALKIPELYLDLKYLNIIKYTAFLSPVFNTDINNHLFKTTATPQNMVQR